MLILIKKAKGENTLQLTDINEKISIADKIAITTFQDELTSIEHPFFTLKSGDTKDREHKNGKVTVTVRPAAEVGLATVFDKDIWIYAISKLQQAIFEEKSISRTISFTPYDFLSHQIEIKVVGLMKN